MIILVRIEGVQIGGGIVVEQYLRCSAAPKIGDPLIAIGNYKLMDN